MEWRSILVVVLGLFVPIVVAMDPVATLPLVVAWTANLAPEERRRQLRAALLTALLLGLGFIVAGQRLLRLLGVDVPDFQIAGGLILLVLGISDLVIGGGHEARGSTRQPDFGVVPIGTPLLVGPATLTTLVVLVDRHGVVPTSLAFLASLLVAWLLFRHATGLTRLLGRNGLRAISKVVSLLLAAIAVQLIRVGVETILQRPGG
jgi:multiple antibiotic resistance protein